MDYLDKEQFHRKYRKVLRDLAKSFGLTQNQYEVRSCKGGSAVLGEVILHTDNLYLQVGGSLCGSDDPTVMYRTCNGRKDYCGGVNQFMRIDQLTTSGVATLKRIACPVVCEYGCCEF